MGKITLNDSTFSGFDYDPRKIDLSEEYPQLEYTIAINGIPCFPKGDIQGIKAKAKQGKTHSILCLMIGILKGSFLNIKSNIDFPKICYFATEEHKRSVAMLAKKVHRACELEDNTNNDAFLVYSLRSDAVDDRVTYIKAKTEQEHPDIIFIDGVRDLVRDFNNIEESNRIIQFLMQLSEQQDCAVVCVLHTNKAASDNSMRGHLGTELLNKCSDVLEVRKEGDIFRVEETDCRNMPTGEWAFSLDDNKIPVAVVVEPQTTKAEQRIMAMQENFQHILAINKVLSYTQLVVEYQEVAGVKEPTAKKHISEALKNCLIRKGADEKYRLW